MEDYKTIKDLLKDLKISVKIDKSVDRGWGGNNYRCVITYKPTGDMTTALYTDSAINKNNKKPDNEDIVGCLLMDANVFAVYGYDENEWEMNFGYEKKELKHIIRECCKTYDFFANFLTNDEISDLASQS